MCEPEASRQDRINAHNHHLTEGSAHPLLMESQAFAFDILVYFSSPAPIHISVQQSSALFDVTLRELLGFADGVESAAKRFLLVLLRDDSRGTPGNSLRDAKNLGDSSTEKEEEKRWT